MSGDSAGGGRRGQFGRNHCRVVHESARAELVAVVDTDAGARGGSGGARRRRGARMTPAALAGQVDAAIVAVPTTAHEEVACALIEAGIDVLVEKPIAPDLAAAGRMMEAAARHGRILQVGHLERFNPAVMELERRATLPLFFEIHRMNLFSPRSLDVDVVLDLMIHDVDIVLALAKAEPAEIRAAGISILSRKGGYRQRAAAVSQRLRGQSDGQPRLHRAGAQAAAVPAATIPVARLRAAGPGRIFGGEATGRSASSRRR